MAKKMIGSGTCPFCGKDNRVEVTDAEMVGYNKYLDGELIQNALPGLSAEKREIMISGICISCQKSIFGSSSEEDIDYDDYDDEPSDILDPETVAYLNDVMFDYERHGRGTKESYNNARKRLGLDYEDDYDNEDVDYDDLPF